MTPPLLPSLLALGLALAACDEGSFTSGSAARSGGDSNDAGEGDDEGIDPGGDAGGDPQDGADGSKDDGGSDADLGSDANDTGEDDASLGEDPCVSGKGLIDFESLPSGEAPKDGMQIGDQFKESHGVTFGLKNGKLPQLASPGAPMTAYSCGGCAEPADGVVPEHVDKLGSFFLTDDGIVKVGIPSPLIVTYDEPVAKASGVLIDVDGTEIWTVRALTDDGTELGKVVLDKAHGLNGGPTPWSFDLDQPKIRTIELVGTGKTSGFGLAFDRFSPRGICLD